MDFEQALCAELQAIPVLNKKVFPQIAEEGTEPPFAIYISSGGEKVQTLEGYTDLTELGFEIHIVTKSYEDLKGLTKAVLDKVKSFFGRAIGQDGPHIKSISHAEPVEDLDEELNFHKSTIDVRVRF